MISNPTEPNPRRAAPKATARTAPPSFIPLEAGKYTTLNLIVGRNKIELGEVSINDWTEGTTIDGGQAM